MLETAADRKAVDAEWHGYTVITLEHLIYFVFVKAGVLMSLPSAKAKLKKACEGL